MSPPIRKTSSLASLSEAELNGLLNPDTVNTTDKVCAALNFLSLFPTIIYNCILLYFLKFTYELATEDNTECPDLLDKVNTVFLLCVASFTKAIMFLFCSRINVW